MSNELWCVYIEGPDDIVAMPSKAAADEGARKINADFADSQARYGVTIKASAKRYDGDAAQHQHNLETVYPEYAHMVEEPKA